MKVLGNLFLALAFASSVAARLGSDVQRRMATEDKRIPNQYIVVLNESVSQVTESGNYDDVTDRANRLVKDANEKAQANTNYFELSNPTILEVYDTALKGFAVSNLSEAALEYMLASADVQYIEEDQVVQLDSVQSSTPSWGLGRLDDKTSLNDYSYSYDFTGSSVVAFVIDTGVFTSHNDFEGRARFGYDATGEGIFDGHGHGTHVGKFHFHSVLLSYSHQSYHSSD
jgi:subtilisin family serine protease